MAVLDARSSEAGTQSEQSERVTFANLKSTSLWLEAVRKPPK
jgi:hypothetical protein